MELYIQCQMLTVTSFYNQKIINNYILLLGYTNGKIYLINFLDNFFREINFLLIVFSLAYFTMNHNIDKFLLSDILTLNSTNSKSINTNSEN